MGVAARARRREQPALSLKAQRRAIRLMAGKEITPIDLAWLAGLFEGEGCIRRGHHGRPVLALAMTDKDVVQRVYEMTGVGRFRQMAPQKQGYKTQFSWTVERCDEVAWLLEMMLPFFGLRRGARAREALESHQQAPPIKRLMMQCWRGHPLSGDNLYMHPRSGGTPSRRCRKCATIFQQAYRDRHARTTTAYDL